MVYTWIECMPTGFTVDSLHEGGALLGRLDCEMDKELADDLEMMRQVLVGVHAEHHRQMRDSRIRLVGNDKVVLSGVRVDAVLSIRNGARGLCSLEQSEGRHFIHLVVIFGILFV